MREGFQGFPQGAPHTKCCARAFALGLSLAVLPGALACNSKSSAADAGVTEAQPQTPLAPPEGHLGDLFMAAPGATWAKARTAVGGVALFLPQSFPALVATLLGIPVTQSAEIDDAVPLVGVLAENETARDRGGAPQASPSSPTSPATVRFTIAVHVKSAERLLGQLTRGETARFNATPDAASHVTILTEKAEKNSAPNRRVAFGLLGNYLVIGGKAADLFALAPYVVRTVAIATPPKDDVVLDLPEKALAGPVLDEVRAARKTMESGPMSFLTMNSMGDTATTILGDASGARCTMNLDVSTVHALCNVTPKPGGAGAKIAADLPVGDTTPLAALPDSMTVGLLWRETLAQRTANAPVQAASLARLLGTASAEDKAAITAAISAQAAARGDWQTVGVAFNGTGPTAVVRAPATDPDAMKKALKQLVDLTTLTSFKTAFGVFGLGVATDKAVVENLSADVTRLRIGKPDDTHDAKKGAPKADPKKAEDLKKGAGPKAIDLLYYVDAGGLYGAAGFDPKEALRALSKSATSANWGSSAAISSLLAPLGNEPFFVLVADLLRMNAMTAGSMPPANTTPVLVAAGHSTQAVWARADLPNPVLQEVIQQYVRRSGAAGGQ